MNDTSSKILNVALELIQTRGYSAISYNDIATELGIRKASIHYHFATKSELGVAAVKRYATGFSSAMKQAEDAGSGPWQLLEAYFALYRGFNESPDRICLCGTLAGEFLALPTPVQKEVSQFFEVNQKWLEDLIQKGCRNGEFHVSGPARKEAQLIFSSLQGALLIKRTIGNTAQLENVIATLKSRLESGT